MVNWGYHGRKSWDASRKSWTKGGAWEHAYGINITMADCQLIDSLDYSPLENGGFQYLYQITDADRIFGEDEKTMGT